MSSISIKPITTGAVISNQRALDGLTEEKAKCNDSNDGYGLIEMNKSTVKAARDTVAV